MAWSINRSALFFLLSAINGRSQTDHRKVCMHKRRHVYSPKITCRSDYSYPEDEKVFWKVDCLCGNQHHQNKSHNERHPSTRKYLTQLLLRLTKNIGSRRSLCFLFFSSLLCCRNHIGRVTVQNHLAAKPETTNHWLRSNRRFFRKEIHHSDTSANEDNPFRNHVRKPKSSLTETQFLVGFHGESFNSFQIWPKI